jgi:hypothetical protein
MKRIIIFTLIAFTLTNCQKEGNLEVVDISYTADKQTIKAGESVVFSIGSGADASSIYTGDINKDFAKSRIAIVELKGYNDTELKNTIFASRLPDLKEFYNYIPNFTTVPASYSFDKGPIKLYQGKLVSFDVSNSTQSSYLQLDVNNTEPHRFTIKPDNAVLPGMLNFTNVQLAALGAVNTVVNNNLSLSLSFPDGHDPNVQTGIAVKLGVQAVIDGKETTISYSINTVRELLTTINFNLTTLLTAWRTANPTLDPKKGIDELRFFINADDPTVTDDNGDLLAYKGRVFIQEVAIGSIQNNIKSFDIGVALPFVNAGRNHKYAYKYNTPGTYKATLVSTFTGRKQYSGDGYRTGRADEILASEYPFERQVKEITITVQ